MDNLYFIYLGFLNLGPTEIVLVLLVAVLLFGGRLPEVARTLGRQFFDMKRNLKDLQDDIYRQDVPPARNLPKPYYRDPIEPDSSPPDDNTYNANPYTEPGPDSSPSMDAKTDETSSTDSSSADSSSGGSDSEGEEDPPKKDPQKDQE